jgi:hypothetical protein
MGEAKKEGLAFTLSYEQFFSIFNVPEYRDAYTNEIIPDEEITLDRFDNDKGYEEGNVFIVSRKTNKEKGSITLPLIKRLYEKLRNE